MSLLDRDTFEDNKQGSTATLKNINAALWEMDIHKKSISWTTGFAEALGYNFTEIESSYVNFTQNLIYYNDTAAFLREANNCFIGSTKTIEIRLFTKTGYQWFQTTINKQSSTVVTGAIVNIHQIKLSKLQLAAKNKQYANAGKIAKYGGWEINVAKNTLLLSNEIYNILELLQPVEISIEEFINFFEPEYRPVVKDAMSNSMGIGKPYELDVQLKTAKNNVLWVKLKAFTTIDDFGNSTKVTGVVQNIDQSKQKENEIKSSFELVNHQNKRLQNFTYIVSHNLRSHASNLQFLVNLYDESGEHGDGKEIFSHIKTISNSLNTTIEHLNQIVKIENEVGQQRQLIKFETLFINILNVLESNIQAANAIVSYDFSNCPDVDYIPAYLESIFHNLLTNALKYRHPERQAIIKCESTRKNENVYLTFEDNGIGIDMERYGQKIFGMYQTFHNNPDSQGIGLFITRNQIEALGGFIHVESAINVGTKFTIKLS